MAKAIEQFTVFSTEKGTYSVHTLKGKDGYYAEICEHTCGTFHTKVWFKEEERNKALERHNEICRNIEKYINIGASVNE